MAITFLKKDLLDTSLILDGGNDVKPLSFQISTDDLSHSTVSPSFASPSGSTYRFTHGLNVTTDSDTLPQITNSGYSPVDRVYPHIFDRAQPTGLVIELVKESSSEAKLALESFGEPDMSSMCTHLTNIAVKMREAYPLAGFNRSLASVIAFLRRSTLLASSSDINRASLNLLITTLNAILIDPMINLNDATDMVDNLSRHGWRGEKAEVDSLFSALIESDVDEEIRQKLLFPDDKKASNEEAL